MIFTAGDEGGSGRLNTISGFIENEHKQ